LSIEQRRTKRIFEVIQEIVGAQGHGFRPGDIASVLRERGQPLGAWEIRGQLSILEAEGLIRLEPESGTWEIVSSANQRAAS
jgi:repressor of nif and glnA expression